MRSRFLGGIFTILVFYIITCLFITRFLHLESSQNKGLIISGILATLNIVAAFFIIALSINKDFPKFTRVFLIGIIARLAGMLTVIFIIFKFMNVDHFVFIFSLFILYFIYQLWELIIINKHLKQG